MRCFSILLSLSAIVALLGIVSTTWADTVIFQDDFEGYTASSTWPSTDDANPGTPPIGDEWWVAEPDVGRVQVLSVAAGNNLLCRSSRRQQLPADLAGGCRRNGNDSLRRPRSR